MRPLPDGWPQNLLHFRGGLQNIACFGEIPYGSSFASTAAMTPAELKQRTKTFAVDVVKFTRTLITEDIAVAHVARQLVRCGTAVGANYRASCRAKSTADFISKMTTVEEEADETLYWLELLVDSDSVPHQRIADLMNEAEQLLRIVVASIKTSRGANR
jgi:four helix bundle protein